MELLFFFIMARVARHFFLYVLFTFFFIEGGENSTQAIKKRCDTIHVIAQAMKM